MNEKYPVIRNWLDFRLGNAEYGNAPPGGMQLALREGGETTFEGVYGYADTEDNRALSAEDRIACGSITKALTVMEALRAVEEGYLSLDTRLVDVIPLRRVGDSRMKDITLRHLTSHTSGLPFNFIIPGVFSGDEGPIDDETFLKNLAEVPLLDNPGERLVYSNSGMTAAGMMIERVMGSPLEELIRKNIFQPLGMTHSGFDAESQPHIKAYSHIGNAACRLTNCGAFSRASGLLSTASDIVKISDALSGLRPDVLSEEGLEYMRTPPIESLSEGEGRGVYLTKEGVALNGLRSYCASVLTVAADRPSIAVLSNQGRHARVRGFNKGIENLWRLSKEHGDDLQASMMRVYTDYEKMFIQTIPLRSGGMLTIDPTDDSVPILFYKRRNGQPYVERGKGDKKTGSQIYIGDGGAYSHTGKLERIG